MCIFSWTIFFWSRRHFDEISFCGALGAVVERGTCCNEVITAFSFNFHFRSVCFGFLLDLLCSLGVVVNQTIILTPRRCPDINLAKGRRPHSFHLSYCRCDAVMFLFIFYFFGRRGTRCCPPPPPL